MTESPNDKNSSDKDSNENNQSQSEDNQNNADDEDVIDSGGDKSSQSISRSLKISDIALPAMRYVGLVFIILAVMSVISLIPAYIYNEFFALPPFLITALVAGLTGTIFIKLGKKI